MAAKSKLKTNDGWTDLDSKATQSAVAVESQPSEQEVRPADDDGFAEYLATQRMVRNDGWVTREWMESRERNLREIVVQRGFPFTVTGLRTFADSIKPPFFQKTSAVWRQQTGETEPTPDAKLKVDALLLREKLMEEVGDGK